VLSPEVFDEKAAGLALRMIQQVDPPVQASVEVSGDLSVGAVNEMSYSQVLAVAQAYNIDLTRDDRGHREGHHPADSSRNRSTRRSRSRVAPSLTRRRLLIDPSATAPTTLTHA
jgi:hypothetical protein